MPIVLRPATDITCCPAGCGPNGVLKPVVTVTDVGEAVREPLGAIISHGETIVFEWVFRDRDGVEIDLTGCTSPSIDVRMQELAVRPDSILTTATGTINPMVRGGFRFTLEPMETLLPGVYEIQFALNITREEVTQIKYIGRGYIIVERSMFADNQQNYGPPPVMELLMHARMGDPSQSTLLKRYEWSPAEIAQCIAKPVQWFNTSLPQINMQYSTVDFPFEAPWRDAITGHLMEVAALGYLRDAMTWQGSAPGSSFNDKDKWDPYLKIAQMKVEGFKTEMVAFKQSVNFRAGYGFHGTAYSYLSQQ